MHPVDAKTDVFRLQSNGAKVRLVCVDADSLSNEQFAALAPAPLRITHIFSFAIGPLGAGRFTRPLGAGRFTRAWSSSDGRRACAPSCHSTCGSRPGFCPRPSRPLAASTRQPGPPRSWFPQKFAFVAIDLPSSKPLEVGAKVWTRFQDNNGKPDPPTNHKIYKGEVTKTSDDGFSVDVKCDRDQTISERTPQWWASHRPINACPIPLDLYKLEAGLRPPKCPTTAVTPSVSADSNVPSQARRHARWLRTRSTMTRTARPGRAHSRS